MDIQELVSSFPEQRSVLYLSMQVLGQQASDSVQGVVVLHTGTLFMRFRLIYLNYVYNTFLTVKH